METHKPKTLEDLPKFVVTKVRRGATSEAGYTSFQLEGGFRPNPCKQFRPRHRGHWPGLVLALVRRARMPVPHAGILR